MDIFFCFTTIFALSTEPDTPLQATTPTSAAATIATSASATQAGARISLLSPAAAAEMVVGLWRRARPALGAAEEQVRNGFWL